MTRMKITEKTGTTGGRTSFLAAVLVVAETSIRKALVPPDCQASGEKGLGVKKKMIATGHWRLNGCGY